jgi:hypothetical protein
VGAPQELTWWQEKAKQNVSKVPTITLPGFGDSIRNWWLELQPEWRKPDFSRRVPADHLWLDYKVPGPGGYFLVVMCMSWWLPLVTPQDRPVFNTLADDITWVLRQWDGPLITTAGGGRRGRTSAVTTPVTVAEGSMATKRKVKASVPTSGKNVKRTRR